MAISTTFTLKFVGAAVERGLARVQSSFKSLGGVAMKVGKSLLSPFAALTALLGTGALAAGLMSFVKGSSGAAASIEDLTMQFETLTKSASITKGLLAEFRKEAAKSPLSIEDYAQAGKLLLNFGTNVDDVMPRLKTLADVSMGNSDRFAGLALAFAQTTAKGRLMGQELNQMTERGFNPLQIISKKTGISVGDLMKRMEEGKISIKAVAEAFRIATSEGGDFYQAIEKGANTTSGKIAKTKDSILGLKIAFGEGFNDGLKIALDAANTKLPELLGKFAEFGTLIGKTISDAVNGDSQRLIMVGSLIGDLIIQGLKLSLRGVSDIIGQFYLDTAESQKYSIVGAVSRQFKGSELHRKGAESQRKTAMRESAELISNRYRQAIELPTALPKKSGAHPNMPGISYAPEGYAGQMMDEKGHKIMFEIKKGIDSLNQKLSPQP
jgi:tape measure domain-containing protein